MIFLYIVIGILWPCIYLYSPDSHQPQRSPEISQSILKPKSGLSHREWSFKTGRTALQSIQECLRQPTQAPPKDLSCLSRDSRKQHSEHLYQWLWPEATQWTSIWNRRVFRYNSRYTIKLLQRREEDAVEWTSTRSGWSSPHPARDHCGDEEPWPWLASLCYHI